MLQKKTKYSKILNIKKEKNKKEIKTNSKIIKNIKENIYKIYIKI